jgi:Zinc finger protein
MLWLTNTTLMVLLRVVDYGIETTTFARSMAFALAVVHRYSQLGTRRQTPDTEFVLGAYPIEAHYPTPKAAEFERWGGTSTTVPNRETGQAVILRLLDFNQCRRISMDKVGVGEAVDGFGVNDPQYPRPQVDEQLWVTLRDTYLSASAEIV